MDLVCRNRGLVSKYEPGKVNLVSKSGRRGRMRRAISARKPGSNCLPTNGVPVLPAGGDQNALRTGRNLHLMRVSSRVSVSSLVGQFVVGRLQDFR